MMVSSEVPMAIVPLSAQLDAGTFVPISPPKKPRTEHAYGPSTQARLVFGAFLFALFGSIRGPIFKHFSEGLKGQSSKKPLAPSILPARARGPLRCRP